MHIAALLARTACFGICLASLAAQTPPAPATPSADTYRFRFDKPFGPYTPGLHVLNQVDASRSYFGRYDELGKPYSGHQKRPIQTLVWYPAEPSPQAKSLTFNDYFQLHLDEEGNFKGNRENATAYDRARLGPATLAAPMHAVRDAKPASGHFPVVVYAPSFSAPAYENADLCEFLASYGFLVLASPDFGAHQRSMTPDLEGIAAQAADISFLVGYAGTLPNADPSEIAVGGFSWGGISNLFAAAHDSRIDALFMLDGSARYFPNLVKEGGIQIQNIALPVLFFTSRDSTLEELAEEKLPTDQSVLNGLTHSNLTIIDMHAMIHPEFASATQRAPDFWTHIPPSDYSRQEIAESYSWVAEYTLQFLNANLKHDPAAAAFLQRTPTENGAPRHLFTIARHPSAGEAATFDDLRGSAGQRGFDHLSEIYAEMKKSTPDFKLTEDQLSTWGYQLINEQHLQEAIAVMKLRTEIYPNSTDAWDGLGEAYRSAGDMPDALRSYTKALEVDPKNDAVKQKLQKYKS